jgi:predicted nucleic acid-binding protein
VARKTARIYGISYAGTLYTLAKAVFEGIITKEEAKGAVNGMVFAGWRYRIKALKPGKGRHLIYWLSSPF